MKNKLLKIGTLVTFLSILFVQLNLHGYGGITIQECLLSVGGKYGHYKEIMSFQQCSNCTHETMPSEIRDGNNNIIGYGYAAMAHVFSLPVTECVLDAKEEVNSCLYDIVNMSNMFCPNIIEPISETGTGTGTY